MASVTPTTTPFTLADANRWYEGDVSDNPEFSGYWSLYGDPPDSKDWWIRNNQLTPESTDWFTRARAGGNQTAAQQAAQDKGGFLGGLGPLARIGAMIPGPWQPFAAAASAVDSASQGDWLGAIGSGYGAYSGFTSPSFKNPLPSLGNIFKQPSFTDILTNNGGFTGQGWESDTGGMSFPRGTIFETGAYTPGGVGGRGMPTSSLTEYNAPNQFGGWSADYTDDWASMGGGVDPGTTDFGGGGSQYADWATQGGGVDPGTSITGGGGNFLERLFKGLTQSTQGSYQFPWDKAIASLFGYMGKRGESKDLRGLMESIMSAQDPAAYLRPQFGQQVSELARNPSNFFKDPAIADIINEAMGLSNATLVSQGYNKSGNQMAELTKVGMREAFKQYIPYLGKIGEFAGLGFGPGSMAGVGSIGQAGISAGNQGLGNLGVGLEAIIRGTQPNLLEILKNTPEGGSILEAMKRTQSNQSLVDVFKNALG